MLSDAAVKYGWHRRSLVVLAIWLIAAALMVSRAIPNINEWKLSDPDDAMRLLQVRDWLAGQSWFDVTQYRLNPPSGGPMHWWRMVDVPIGAVILIARPFFDQHGAETAALIVVPLLTLGVAMLVIHRIALRLMDEVGALLAVAATPLSLGAMTQMRILRIDHHGWQIVCALIALLAMLDDRPRRSGAVAGAAVAAWLNISIEGLPFAAAVGAWFAIEWLMNPSAGRLKFYLESLALVSAALFGATHWPSSWFAHPHDVLNVAHLAGFATAWLCVAAAARLQPLHPLARLGVLAGIGAVTLGVMFAVDPHFLQPPFASLDPLVKTLWYDRVQEGQPIWKLSPFDAAVSYAQPLVGLGGALLALWLTRGTERYRWALFTYVLCEMTIAGVVVTREMTIASMVALPATAFLCKTVLSRARRIGTMPVRTVATAGSLLIMVPAYAAPGLVMPTKPQLVRAWAASEQCETLSEVRKLNSLPASNLAAPLDITPSLLLSTPHRAIASGYHRNVSGIHDIIVIFSGPLSQAQAILARRQIDYVVFCPDTPETFKWAFHGPHGLAAMLNANRAPQWLEPVPIPGLQRLRVWRVRKDLPGVPAKA